MADLDALTDRLPIFPLPRLVMLPGERVPLHVFEPRYRALVEHLLEGHRTLGLATLQPVDDPGDPEHPPLHPEVGVGRIVRHQALPDGRSNIRVAFEQAGTVTGEVATDEPFRRVRLDLVPPAAPASYPAADGLRVLAAQVATLVGPLGTRERWFELQGAAYVDAMARMFLQDPDARRAYLVATDGAERVARVESALLDWLGRLQPVGES